jgi:NitT/TauT family transport system substrate-binding protein
LFVCLIVFLIFSTLWLGCASKPVTESENTNESIEEASAEDIFETSILAFGVTQVLISEVIRDVTGPPNGILLKVESMHDARSIYVAMRANEYDFYMPGWITVADMRAREEVFVKVIDVPYIAPVYLYTLVDSGSINEMSDLKGKRIGLMGTAASTSAQIFKLQLKRYYDIDLDSDLDVLYGAPPVIHEALKKGDLDVVLNTPSVVPELLDDTKFKVITEQSTLWEETEGYPLLTVGLVTYDELLDNNPDGVKRFVKAEREAIQYLIDNPQKAEKLISSIMELPEGETLSTLTKVFLDLLYLDFDQDAIDNHLQFGELFIEMFGTEVVQGIPKDIFTLEYIE